MLRAGRDKGCKHGLVKLRPIVMFGVMFAFGMGVRPHIVSYVVASLYHRFRAQGPKMRV